MTVAKGKPLEQNPAYRPARGTPGTFETANITTEIYMPFDPSIVFAIAINFLAAICLLFWLGFRQMAKSREFSHMEKMRALELGQRLEPSEPEEQHDKSLHNLFWISFWIGAGVPIAATSAASAIVVQSYISDFRIIIGIWICAAVISVASVICATVLMICGRRGVLKSQESSRKCESPEV